MDATDNGSPISSEEDAKYGFQRPEMYSSNLANTIDAYDRHVFLCYKGPDAWAPRVEESDTDLLPKLLSAAVKARKDDITVKVSESTQTLMRFGITSCYEFFLWLKLGFLIEYDQMSGIRFVELSSLR